LLNLYIVKTRVVITDPWEGPKARPLLDSIYKQFVVASSFDTAVRFGKELAKEQCRKVAASLDETSVSGVVGNIRFKRQFPSFRTLEATTIECTQEATGIQIDPSVLAAQVAEHMAR
jgi:hypothetical protein